MVLRTEQFDGGESGSYKSQRNGYGYDKCTTIPLKMSYNSDRKYRQTLSSLQSLVPCLLSEASKIRGRGFENRTMHDTLLLVGSLRACLFF